MKPMKLIAIAAAILLLASCETPNVAYFKDLDNGMVNSVSEVLDIRVRPEDKLSIVVKSKNAQLSDLFNLPVMSQRIGYTTPTVNQSQNMSLYTVDSHGNIDFPVLGTLSVAGLTREQVANLVKQELINNGMVKDPVVTVEYGNLSFSVMGEVARPGRYAFDRDHLTLLEAISTAGDLTIKGKRENVLVMRENSKGTRTTYRVDLTKGADLYRSPVFYLQQNDVIFVEPNDYRAREATVNGNNVRSTSFWISIASLATTVAVLVFK